MNWQWPPLGDRAVIATRHGKERVIAPTLAALGLEWDEIPATFDSDQFGTFTRDIPRRGSQIAAARAKADAALLMCPQARIAIASEGAFGPDPAFPVLPLNMELVLLRDRTTGLELVGYDRSWDTNFAHQTVKTIFEAEDFAARIGFPEHGVVVMNETGCYPIDKEVATFGELRDRVVQQLMENGRIWLEADMRAYRNPTRMRSIERAAQSLAKLAMMICPECQRPGFEPRSKSGRPCGWCGASTIENWLQQSECTGCGHQVTVTIDPERRADPGNCPMCNP